MERILTQIVDQSYGTAAYLAIFGILVACGMGLPAPEDVWLATGGFLAHLGHANIFLMMGVGFLGISAGDSIIFFAGRRIGSKVGVKEHGFFGRIVTPEKRKVVEGLFRAHGHKIIMAARFLPGVRAVTFFTAGSTRMAYWRFILWDGMAALISAPLFVYLGYFFGDNIEMLFTRIRHGQVRVIAALVVAAGLYFVYARWRNQRLKARSAAAMSTPTPVPPSKAPVGAGADPAQS